MSVKHFPSFSHSEGRVQIKDSMSQMISISSSVDNGPEHSFKPVLFSSSGVGGSLRTEQIKKKNVSERRKALWKVSKTEENEDGWTHIKCISMCLRVWCAKITLEDLEQDLLWVWPTEMKTDVSGQVNALALWSMFCKISHCSSQHRAQWCAQQCLAAASLIKVKPLVYLLQEQCHCFLASEKWDVHVVTI